MANRIEKTSVNTMADAFKASESVLRLGFQAKAVLRRKGIRPRTAQKWHRIGAVALLVANAARKN